MDMEVTGGVASLYHETVRFRVWFCVEIANDDDKVFTEIGHLVNPEQHHFDLGHS